MIIKKKRIRSLNPYQNILAKKSKFIIGVSDINRFSNILKKLGFSEELSVGEILLPSTSFGSVSRFNAEGKYIKHKDRAMETVYRTVEWHWKEWHGPYERVERSKFVDVPYKRYPRTFIFPPSTEIKIARTLDNKFFVVSPILTFQEKGNTKIIHIINLFLEIFGEAQFFTENLKEIIKSPFKRLNWEVLPSGSMPWQKLKENLESVLKNVPDGNRAFIEHRLKNINRYSPDFTAIGKAGFQGYIILGFKDTNVYICESLFYGNAIYIFGENWKTLSKMTKAQILNRNLQKARIVHLTGWKRKLDRVLNQ